MSKKIDKKELLKNLILALHKGSDPSEVYKEFKKHFSDITPEEISKLEQELVDSGALTPEQITKLCDLHVSLFKESLDKHRPPEEIPGHPVHTYVEENKFARSLIKKLRERYDPSLIKELSKIVVHYTRLQNQLFPELERKGFTGPSQVMWAKQDEIRDMFKSVTAENYKELLDAVEEQIYKEEKILYPTALKLLDEEAWSRVRNGEEEIGYAWIKPGNEWKPITAATIHSGKPKAYTSVSEIESKEGREKKSADYDNRVITLDTGKLPAELINIMLKTIPGDITVIDENDEVVYYTNTEHRIFPRSPNIIGRKVQRCHPPKSIDVVNRIIKEFREGRKDVAEFWINLKGRFILIRYYALRDKEGNYRGIMEFSQDLTYERGLEGEKRLLDWDRENP